MESRRSKAVSWVGVGGLLLQAPEMVCSLMLTCTVTNGTLPPTCQIENSWNSLEMDGKGLGFSSCYHRRSFSVSTTGPSFVATFDVDLSRPPSIPFAVVDQVELLGGCLCGRRNREELH